MRNRAIIKWLSRELPVWVEKGWIEPKNQQPILEHVADRNHGIRHIPLAFSFLGVVLLGTGIITYFAGNWEGMTKLTKLTILFTSMWVAYGLSSTFLKDKRAPALGQAMLLLGVILFGANIMLIAQIYHIDSHYPNGVLLWSFGAILVAYLMPSQAAMVLGVVLAVLWTSMESITFNGDLHWPFLIIWAGCLPVIHKMEWRPAFHTSLIGLLIWSWVGTGSYTVHHEAAIIHVIQILFLSYLGVYILGAIMGSYQPDRSVLGLMQPYAVFGGLISFYALSFPILHEGSYGSKRSPLVIVFAIAVLVVIGLGLWQKYRSRGNDRSTDLKWGEGILISILVLLVLNHFIVGRQANFIPIFYNLLLFGGLIWLIYFGYQRDNRYLVNISFVFFGLTLLTRYFDTFWSLLNRSFFFTLGGLVLIVGGYILEKQRRKLLGRMPARSSESGAS